MSTKLDLVWQAQFTNGQILHQYDDGEQTKEHLFGEVLARQDELKLFSLINTKTNRIYQLDLERGRFHFLAPGFIQNPEDLVQGEPTIKYRLIHFRRREQTLGWKVSTNKVESLGLTTKFFLGYQYTTADGKNVKHIAQITENDEVYLV